MLIANGSAPPISLKYRTTLAKMMSFSAWLFNEIFYTIYSFLQKLNMMN